MSGHPEDGSGFQDQLFGCHISELSLNSMEFKSGGDALQMLSADEKQLIEENRFNVASFELASDGQEKSMRSLPENWLLSVHSMTPPSWYSGSPESEGGTRAKRRISIGSYMAKKSEPLGNLEGADSVERPNFGMSCRSPAKTGVEENDGKVLSDGEGDDRWSGDGDGESNTTLREDSRSEKSFDPFQDEEEEEFYHRLMSDNRSLASPFKRQLSVIAETSRELDRSEREILASMENATTAEDRKASEKTGKVCTKKENKDPGRESVGGVVGLPEGSRADYVSDWVRETLGQPGDRTGSDIEGNSPTSSTFRHSSTPLKSATTRRMSSPVSEIGPRGSDRIRLSTASSADFSGRSDLKGPFVVPSEFRFDQVTCIGTATIEALEVINSSDDICSLRTTLTCLSVGGTVVGEGHEGVFVFKTGAFMRGHTSQKVHMKFKPRTPGTHVARLVIHVEFLTGERVEKRKHFVSLVAIAEEPKVKISLPGYQLKTTTDILKRLDFGIVPGSCHKIERMSVINEGRVVVPVMISVGPASRDVKECFVFQFKVRGKPMVRVKFGGGGTNSDCLFNASLRPGERIEVEVAFSGPINTIGTKNITCLLEVHLLVAKKDFRRSTRLDAMELVAVTSVPSLGIKASGLVLSFFDDHLVNKARLTNKGSIPLSIETESVCSAFSVRPTEVVLETGQQVFLEVAYDPDKRRELFGDKKVLESHVSFRLRPNGQKYKIRVAAHRGSNEIDRATTSPLVSHASERSEKVDGRAWEVTTKKCVFDVDPKDRTAGRKPGEVKNFCIINNSDLMLSFNLASPRTVCLSSSSCVVLPRSSKVIQMSLSPDVLHLLDEGYARVGVVSISCPGGVKCILVDIKDINVPERPSDGHHRSESEVPLATLGCCPGQGWCDFDVGRWTTSELTVFVSDCGKDACASLELTSLTATDLIWNLKPCEQVLSQMSFALPHSSAPDVFTFDSTHGVLRPGSVTVLTVIVKAPIPSSCFQLWLFDFQSKISWGTLKLGLRVVHQPEDFTKPKGHPRSSLAVGDSPRSGRPSIGMPVSPARTPAPFSGGEGEADLSQASTVPTETLKFVRPFDYLNGRANRLVSRDRGLYVIPEYLNFQLSTSEVEVIEKVEFKNKSEKDVCLTVTKMPEVPFVMDHRVFTARSRYRLKIPIKCLARPGGRHHGELVVTTEEGESFTVHLIKNE